MSEPDALRCPGCGEVLPASLELLSGAVRCDRCGVEVPIPEPAAPDLTFDAPPPELPAPDAAAEPVIDLSLTPRSLDIEHWFPDGSPPTTDPLVVSEEFGPAAELRATELPDTDDAPGDKASYTALYTTPSTFQVELTRVVPPDAEPPEIAPADPQPPAAMPPPLPEGLTVYDAPVPGVPLLPTPPLLPATPEEPEVLVPDEPVPVVQPIVPLVKPAPRVDRPRTAKPESPPLADGERRPKPQVGIALVVMALLLVVVAIGLAVIGYALWSGLQTAAKPRRAEVGHEAPTGFPEWVTPARVLNG